MTTNLQIVMPQTAFKLIQYLPQVVSSIASVYVRRHNAQYSHKRAYIPFIFVSHFAAHRRSGVACVLSVMFLRFVAIALLLGPFFGADPCRQWVCIPRSHHRFHSILQAPPSPRYWELSQHLCYQHWSYGRWYFQ